MNRSVYLSITIILALFCAIILIADWLTHPQRSTESVATAVMAGSSSPVLPSSPSALHRTGTLVSLPYPPPPPVDPAPWPSSPPQMAPTQTSRDWTPFTYRVKKQDTLQKLAKLYYGRASAWEIIARANPEVDPRQLHVGQVLKIPTLPRPERR